MSYKIHNAITKLLVLSTVLVGSAALAEVVVIVHPSNVAIIDQTSVKKIFTGKSKTFPNGEHAVPIELKTGEVRITFLKQVLNKDQSSFDSLWSRILFTGKGVPPKAYDSQDEVKHLVAQNPNLIGYIDSSKVDASVKVVEMDYSAVSDE